MFSYNITFVVAPSNEKELIRFIIDNFIPQIYNQDSAASNPALKKVVETGGDKPGADHGVSLALSVDFISEDIAHAWDNNFLIPALRNFSLKFGNQALFITTLLENIPLQSLVKDNDVAFS